MASRGWESVKESDIAAKISRGTVKASTQPQERSKYRNVKTLVDGIRFDSRREADYWLALRERMRTGEITELQHQVAFPLMCPQMNALGNTQIGNGLLCQVAVYVADFTYRLNGVLMVVDAKGLKTQMYRLKAKWLKLQQGIDIIEV